MEAVLPPGRNRAGFALVFTILVALLLSAAALGMVAVGFTEIQLAGAVTRHTEARLEAESLARTLFRDWSTRPLADLEPGRDHALTEAPGSAAAVERVDTTLYLIRTEVRVPPGVPGGASGRASLLVSVFDPRRTAAAFPAAATVDGTASVAAGRLDGHDACGDGRDRPGLVARSLEAGPTAVIDGSPPLRLEPAPPPAAPDPLAPPLIAAIATLQPRMSTATPRPLARDGVCLEDPRNWGATAAAHPCHSLLPLVFADHDLTLSGGEARAVLVVHGDLRVTADSRFDGIVLVRDTLTVEAEALIRGAVRAGTLVLNGGAIRADPCAVDDASSAPALDAGYRPSDRWWIPAF